MAGLTAKEMQYEAKIVYEALASADAPGYTDRQWSILLTQAQEKVIIEIINEGLDKNESNRRAISKLLTPVTLNLKDLPTSFWPNSKLISFPEVYFHMVYDNIDDTIKLKSVSYDYVNANLSNPFENPNEKEFWKVVSNEGIIIITDGVTEISKYKLIYLKKPIPIITKENIEIEGYKVTGAENQISCELDPIIHRRIVERAGRLAEAYVNNQAGYQLSRLEEQSTEQE